MLHRSIARKVLRFRSVRATVRTYHNYQPAIPPDLPPLSGPSFDGVLPHSFPLYRPLSRPTYEEDVDIASLPSDHYLQKGVKIRLTRKVNEDTPELTEEDLRTFYRGLIESGKEQSTIDVEAIGAPKGRLRLARAERQEILARMETRLFGDLQAGLTAPSALSLPVQLATAPIHHRLAWVLPSLAGPSFSQPASTFSIKGKERAVTAIDVPLGLVGRREWDALFDEFIERRDARGAEAFLDVMRRHGISINKEHLNDIMAVDAKAGRGEEVARLGSDLVSAGLPFDAAHHDAFVASLLHASPPQFISAVTYLREHEQRGQPLPQSSYNLVLSHLLIPTSRTQPTSHTRSHAWDLFSHMRLVAFPTPSREIYTTMIKACGDARDPQPERARDLWIEMTTEGEKIVPRRHEYDAIIRALSSTKADYLEAFELLRQMIALHQDAVLLPFEDEPSSVLSSFVPTVETFTALLEGTKRAGDLERARWILSEIVRLARSSQNLGEKRLNGPNEEMMAGIFMTYAAWRPEIKRQNVKIRKGEEDRADEAESKKGLDIDVLAETRIGDAPALHKSAPNSPPSSPRTSADAIRESAALLDEIIYAATFPTSHPVRRHAPFGGVQLNTRVINSYLSVHLAHAPSVAAAREAWTSTWDRVNEIRKSVVPNGWSYLQVLERCAAGSRGRISVDDPAEAPKWGKEIWEVYRRFTAAHSSDTQASGIIDSSQTSRRHRAADDTAARRREKWLLGLGERQVERSWRSIIRLYALSDDLATAMDLVDQFHTLHPPSSIVQGYSPLPDMNLAIRMTSIGSTPEPDVPPHLIWQDLDVLHQRLVRDEDWNGVAKVKWITKSYEGALMKRRRFRVKGVGVARERNRERKQVRGRLAKGEEAEKLEAAEEGDGAWGYEEELDGMPDGGGEIEGLRATG